MARTGNVYITINGKDNVSKTLRNVNKGLGGLSKKSLAVGTAIGTALGGIALKAIGALTGQITGAFQKLGEQDQLIKRTNNVLQTTGNIANVTADQILKQSSALEMLTGMEQEAIQNGQNLLLTFTNLRNEAGEGNDIFTQASSIMVDLATAMGGDPQGAAIQLGKALNDPTKGITALTRVGVSFTQQQKDQVKALQASGDILGAQKVILGELNTQFGGAGKAAGESFAGQMKILEHVLTGLIEDALRPLLPLIIGFAKFLTGTAVPAIQRAADAFNAWFGGGSLQGIGDVITQEIFPALIGIGNILFKRVIPQVLDFAKKLGAGLMPIIKTVAGFIKGTVIPVFQQIAQAVVRDVLPIVRRLADFFIQRVLPAASTVATFIAGVLGPVFRKVADVITQKVLPVVVKLANFFVNNVLPVIADLAGALWGNGSGPLPTALNAIAGVFSFVADGVGFLFGLLEDLLDILGKVAQAIADSPIGQIAGAIGGFVGDLFGGQRAAGGPVAGGKAYLVGEKGPELFVPGQSGSIVPNTGLAMPAMSAGGAGSVAGEIRRAFAGLGIYLDGESVGRVSDRRLSVALATTGTTSRSASAFRYGR
jgi:hypothetical protein